MTIRLEDPAQATGQINLRQIMLENSQPRENTHLVLNLADRYYSSNLNKTEKVRSGGWLTVAMCIPCFAF